MSRSPARNMFLLGGLVMIMVGSSTRGAETPHDFGRYQVIIDRSPFGAMPGSSAEVPQPPFSARYTFVGTAKLDDTQPLMAIILDKEGSRTYFKAEGETIGETTVVKIEKADKAQVKLVLKQGLEVATLVMDTKASAGAAQPAPSAQPQPFIPGQSPGPVPPQPGVRRIPFRRGG